MQDNMTRNKIRIIGTPEGEEEDQGIENLFEKVMMKNSPNLMSEKKKMFHIKKKSRKHRESQARVTQQG